MLLVTCGGAAEPTPDIEAMVAVEVKEALSTQATSNFTATEQQSSSFSWVRGTDYTDLFTHVEHLWDQLVDAKENEDAAVGSTPSRSR